MGIHNISFLSDHEESAVAQKRKSYDDRKKKNKTARKVARKAHKSNLMKGR